MNIELDFDWRKIYEDFKATVFSARPTGSGIFHPERELRDVRAAAFLRGLLCLMPRPATIGERVLFWKLFTKVVSGDVELQFALEHGFKAIAPNAGHFMIKIGGYVPAFFQPGVEGDEVIPPEEPDPWLPKSEDEFVFFWLGTSDFESKRARKP